MKKIKQWMCFLFVVSLILGFVACDFAGGTTQREVSPEKPIKKLDLNNRNTAMLVGETMTLDYTISPEDTDEKLIISSGDSSVAEVANGVVTAKKVGTTWISLKVPSDKSNFVSKEIQIRVVEKLDYSSFKSQNGNDLQRATVSVFCKRYDKNWLGVEKNVNTTSGKGIIVKSAAYANYFLTDKSIFDKTSTNYAYEEWYITDYLGTKYTISGLKYHLTASIALGTFTSSSSYDVAKIFDAYAYKGDYAIALSGNPLTCRIEETGYLALVPTSSERSNVFYHEAGLGSRERGLAVFNAAGEIIGINLKYSGSRAVAVSAIEIRELYNAIFNPSHSGGGPINSIGDISG